MRWSVLIGTIGATSFKPKGGAKKMSDCLRDLLKLEDRLRTYDDQLRQAKTAGSTDTAMLIQEQIDDCQSELKRLKDGLDDVAMQAYQQIVAERKAMKSALPTCGGIFPYCRRD
jgi:hypothetical protein